MAEGFALADAFVRIRPDSAGFRAEATSQIKAAMSGLNPTVPVTANTNPAKAAIAAFNTYAKAFLREQSVNVTADTTGAKASIAALATQLGLLTRKTWALQVSTDDAGAQAKLARIALQLRALTATIAKPRVTLLQYEQVQAQALSILATLEKLNDTVSTAHIDIDDATAEQRLALLTVQLAQLVSKARDIRVGLSDAGDIANINALINAMGKLGSRVATIDFKAINLDALTQSEQDLKLLDKTLGQEFPDAVNRAGFAWRGWATLMNRVPLFGGTVLSGTIGMIAVWHILADAIIEVAAVLIPAGVAFAAFAAAAAPATEAVVNHMKAVLTVTQATALAVPPFTNAFRQLSTAITPKVYELFGEVMNTVNSRMGAFASLATRAGQVMDMFGARIELAITTSGFQKFLANAISDLTTVGDIIGNVLGIIGNLIKMVAGVAGVLFHAILDITGALEAFTASPVVQFLGRIALGFHGAWIWIGLAASAVLGMIPLLARLTGGMSAATAEASGFDRIRLAATDLAANTGVLGVRIGNIIPTIKAWAARMVVAGGAAEDAGLGTKILSGAMGTLSSIPVAGWAALAAVAIGGVAFWLATAKTATQQWTAALQANIDQTANWFNVVGKLNTALVQVNTAIAQQPAATAKAASSVNSYGIAVGQVGNNLTGALQRQNDLRAAQQQFSGEAQLAIGRLGNMAARFGGLTAAMGYAQLAGIKVTDVFKAQGGAWANDLQQINALIQGYKYMGVAQGALGNSVLALQVTTDDQIAAVQKLNQEWTTMLGIVAGGETTFVAFAQQMLTVKQATGGLNSALTTTNGVATSTISPTGRLNANLNASAKAANAAKTSLTGLNQSSLQYRQAAGQLITDAQAYYEALQTQSAAATDAARGQMLLQQAGAAILTILGPQTKGSATLRQQVFLLAQQFGFTRQQMEEFITKGGSVKANEKILEQVNNELARSVSNVGRDWAAMATTLSGQVKSALSGVALQSSGARYAAEQLYKAIHAGFPDLASEHDWFAKLVVDLHNSGLSWSQAKTEAEAYTKGLGGNWAEIASGRGPRSQLIGDMQTTLGITKNTAIAMINYATELKHTSDSTAAGRATRQQLVTDLVNTADRANISTIALEKMIAQILKIPKSEALSLIMKGSGTFSISQIGSLSRPGGKLSGPQGTPSGMGGRVPGTGIHDTVPAMLTPGEAVIPKHLVPHVAPFLNHHNVPGFGGGGFVGSGTFDQIAPQMATFALTSYNTFKTTMTNDMVAAMKAALKAAEAQAVAALAFTPGGSRFGGSSAAIAFARANLPAGWSWTALFDLWQRESGWNPYAVNPTSGAYGIPQSLGHGHPYALGDYANQIRWGLAYIRSRYGDSQNAWAHELSSGWYDQGGWLPPGLTMAWNGTGRYEPVGRNSDFGGGGVNVYLTVQPGAVMTGNAMQIGTALGQYLLEYTKRGGKLFPAGTTIGTAQPPSQAGTQQTVTAR